MEKQIVPTNVLEKVSNGEMSVVEKKNSEVAMHIAAFMATAFREATVVNAPLTRCTIDMEFMNDDSGDVYRATTTIERTDNNSH